jgi:hypothetical protein
MHVDTVLKFLVRSAKSSRRVQAQIFDSQLTATCNGLRQKQLLMQ